jgi:3-oxoacyl-[acyl-carrier protein] reductase
VNNAGITRDGLILRMKPDDWDAVLRVNLTGAFNFCKAAVPGLIKQRWGRIVNISSVVGAMGNAGQVNYAASKAGLLGLTKSLAREVASRGVTVNAVAPGFIDTAMTQAMPEKAREALLAQIPAGRLGQAADVADAVRYLASEAAGYITGQVLHVNGGMYT